MVVGEEEGGGFWDPTGRHRRGFQLLSKDIPSRFRQQRQKHKKGVEQNGINSRVNEPIRLNKAETEGKVTKGACGGAFAVHQDS